MGGHSGLGFTAIGVIATDFALLLNTETPNTATGAGDRLTPRHDANGHGRHNDPKRDKRYKKNHPIPLGIFRSLLLTPTTVAMVIERMAPLRGKVQNHCSSAQRVHPLPDGLSKLLGLALQRPPGRLRCP